MRLSETRVRILVFVIAGAVLTGFANPPEKGKIPMTTNSDEALREYLAGRDLSERLQVHDAVAHFDKAIVLDPSFAAAELGRAGVSTTADEFLDHLRKAVALSERVSDGERLAILSTDAGANGRTARQRELLEELVARYPDDERAHNLLGTYFFGLQDYAGAVRHLQKAADLSPTFSLAYNLLGYAYRFLERYAEAEKTFAKYTQLIPNDPNPYDSYAELLMKEGKFDESITNYSNALAKDADFISAKQGKAFNELYKGNQDEAEAELHAMLESARDDGERRQALFDMAVAHLDGGNSAGALQDLDNEYAVAQRRNDSASMAADLDAKGIVLEQMGELAGAKELYDRELAMIQASDLSKDIKDGIALGHRYHAATLALAAKDLPGAGDQAQQYEKDAGSNPFRIRLSHELKGMIALEKGEYRIAIRQLHMANLQNPQNLYRLALAYQAAGDGMHAREFCEKAAHFYSLPNLNYAFIRQKSVKMLDEM